MPTVTQQQLEKLLNDYSGKWLDGTQLSSFQRVSMPFFTDPKLSSDPRVQFTFQLDVTSIYRNFEKNYKTSPEATFTAFIKWILIKSMYNTPFYWRYINGQWYDFKNLPLEISVATNDERQQLLYFLNNVISEPWGSFSLRHHALASGKFPDALDQIKALPLYALAIEIVGVHFPRMTSYSTTDKIENIHQPWIVFSDRYQQENALYLPLHISFSHATLTPKLVENFLKKFCFYAKLLPEQVDAIYQSDDVNYVEANLSSVQPCSFLPGFQTNRHLQITEDPSQNDERVEKVAKAKL